MPNLWAPGEPRIYDAISKCSKVPLSTLHHRAYGRRSEEQKAQKPTVSHFFERESPRKGFENNVE